MTVTVLVAIDVVVGIALVLVLSAPRWRRDPGPDTFAGAMHDLELATRRAGWIIADRFTLKVSAALADLEQRMDRRSH